MSKKPIIVFEGIEGSGKSHHISIVSKYLSKKKINHIKIREPGGNPNSEKIRKFKLKNKYPDELQALFCWIPFVGSLLLISLGIKKASIYKTGFFMFIGRLGRYIIWAMLTLKIINIG